MEYIAHTDVRNITISGEDIIEAVGNNINKLAREMGLGNAAGITYDKVTLGWKEGILGGKGCCEVRITARGSDALVNYDPYTDESKTAVIWIPAKREELPEEEYEYPLSGETANELPLTPFDKVEDPGQKLGMFMALCNEISAEHARVPVSQGIFGGVTDNIATRFPTLMRANPHKYIMALQQAVQRTYPKNDAATQKLLDRTNELAMELFDVSADELRKAVNEGNWLLCQAKVHLWFKKQNNITALAYYRQKAGMTGKQLAEAIGVSDRQIRNYESMNGSTLGDAKNVVVENLAKALNVKTNDLVEYGVPVYVNKDTGEIAE